MRILIFSHMHPEESIDGAVLCSYAHAREMSERGIATAFIGGRKSHHKNMPLFEKIKSGPLEEYLMDVKSPAAFSRTGLGWDVFHSLLGDFLRKFTPDIIHFHSTMPFGFNFINSTCQGPWKRVLTLHNYTNLCPSDTCIYADNGDVCIMEDSAQCIRCFPDISQEAFTYHRRQVLEHLNQLDALTTPGYFAKERYVAAGMQEDRIHVIRNGTHIQNGAAAQRENDGVLRLGYIGRNSSLKGLNVLLAAMLQLPHELRMAGKIHLSIFGPLDESETATFHNVLAPDYVAQVFSLVRTLKDSVTLHGPFSNHQLPELMREIDCLVVPSVWWEVTPCTIQEAFACNKPVLCSNIGGMAEMVTDGVDGLHFEMGAPNDLKEKILLLHNNPELLSKLRHGIQEQPTIRGMGDAYLSLYGNINADLQ
jgi:glycosyltransferase involved in cell wall biosynthesis